MIGHRTEEEVRRYDLLKLGILLLLLALLALTWFATRHLQLADLPGGATSGETQAQATMPAPVALSLDRPSGPLTAGSITLSGTAGPGMQVTVLADDQPVGMALADADGFWTTTVELPPGDHILRAQAFDGTGIVAGETEPVAVTVGGGVIPPSLDAPAETQVDASSGETILPIAPGSITLTGQGQPGTHVEMLIDGLRIGLAEVDSTGAWALPVNMPAGDYSLQFNTLDASGAVLSSADPIRVTVGGSATGEVQTPEAPAVTIRDALVGLPGNYSILLSLLEISGMAESLPGSGPFTLFAPTDEAFGRLPQRVLDDLKTNPQALSRLLQHHILGGTHTAADLRTTPPVTLSGYTLGVAPQGDTLTIDGATVLSADAPADGGVIHTIDRVLLPPLAENVQPPIIDESGVPTFRGTALTIVGKAEPGRTILVELNGESFGEPATVNDDGTWLVSGTVTLGGNYQIIAYMLDAASGLEAISQPVALQVVVD